MIGILNYQNSFGAWNQESHCNLGALATLWLNKSYQSLFFDQTGRWRLTAALIVGRIPGDRGLTLNITYING